LYWLLRLAEFNPGPLIPDVPWTDSLSAPLERPDVDTFWKPLLDEPPRPEEEVLS